MQEFLHKACFEDNDVVERVNAILGRGTRTVPARAAEKFDYREIKLERTSTRQDQLSRGTVLRWALFSRNWKEDCEELDYCFRDIFFPGGGVL